MEKVFRQKQLAINKALSQAKKAIKQGNVTLAIQIYKIILEHQPNSPVAKKALLKLQKGLENHQSLEVDTENPSEDLINDLLNLYHSGQIRKTELSCKELLQIYPQSLVVINILGIALQEQGRFLEALEIYDRIITLKPDFAEAYNNRGNILKELGEFEKALESYYKAIKLKPDIAEVYNNRGIVLNELGEVEKALENYDQAIKLNSNYADAYCNRGVALQEMREYATSLLSHQKALFLNPENSMYWNAFADILSVVKFTSYNDDLVNNLLQILDQPTVDPKYISSSIISALHYSPVVLNTLKLSKSEYIDKNVDYLTEQLSTEALLLKIMELSSLEDLDIENMFTKIRKAMLHKALREDDKGQSLTFYVAMAMHCFVNEYVFIESEEEKQEINLLQEKVKTTLEKEGTISPFWIAVLGAYRLLYSFPWAEDLLQYEWTDEIRKLIVQQINNLVEEKALHSKIGSITTIDDKVSQVVRSQYEENPYPRWINTGCSDKPRAIRQVLQSIKLNMDFNAQQFSDKPDILIAGCGTGQHALSTASRFLNCNVLAVDLSLSSLSYAKRKTQELGLVNIEYMQGDILNLGQLKRKFDIIESVGVLHHMENPLAGWKVLVSQLHTGGVMKIGLYSEIARQGITEARSQISKKRYIASADDIRRYRKEILSMDKNSKIAEVVSFSDFYSLSECRDLLFHVQEHRFTLLQIEEALRNFGLKFLGFELIEDSVRNKFIECYPSKEALISLPIWHQFELENPNTFIHMYQFWVQKMSLEELK